MSRFPDQLETDRLILRPPTPADGQELIAAIAASFAELTEWMPWAKKPYGEDEFAAYLKLAQTELEEEAAYHVLLALKSSGRIVGGSSLFANWDVPKFEIGYWLLSAFVGHGYASESARALIGLAFETLGAKRVQITMDDRNEPSWAVAERLGFEWEATLRNDALDNAGELRDTRIYAMFDPARLR